MEKRNDGLTEEEGEVMDKLVNAWNLFTTLERQHPGEMNEFGEGIHKCQDLLALRILRRDYPKGWPIKRCKEPGGLALMSPLARLLKENPNMKLPVIKG